MSAKLCAMGVVTLALVLASARPAAALELSGTGTLISGAFLPEVGDEANVFVVNSGPRGMRVEIELLRADDLSVVETSGSLTVPAGTGIQHVFLPSDIPVLVRVRFRVTGSTVAKVSLQVIAATGDDYIFTDGFESGDLAS